MDVINELLTAEDPLLALSSLDGTRKRLDLVERQLIESARAGGAGWSQIAAALGLRSRQAAEQRWLRLSGESYRDPAAERARRARQRTVDAPAGEAIAGLRAAVRETHLHIQVHPDWDALDPRAVLVRAAVSAARTAPPGALYALAAHAVADMRAFVANGHPLDLLATALAAATPAPGASTQS